MKLKFKIWKNKKYSVIFNKWKKIASFMKNK